MDSSKVRRKFRSEIINTVVYLSIWILWSINFLYDASGYSEKIKEECQADVYTFYMISGIICICLSVINSIYLTFVLVYFLIKRNHYIKDNNSDDHKMVAIEYIDLISICYNAIVIILSPGLIPMLSFAIDSLRAGDCIGYYSNPIICLVITILSISFSIFKIISNCYDHQKEQLQQGV